MTPPFATGIYAIVDGERLGLHERTDPRAPIALLRTYAQAAVAGGAVAVQLRLKHLPAGHPVRLTAVTAIRRAIGNQVPLVVDDDLLAAQGGHVGLHWGQTDGVPGHRPPLSPTALFGWSTHTLAQVEAARDFAVDYLGFGPIRPTDGKRDHDATTGLTGLLQAVAAARVPVVAIGGLTLADVADIRSTGAHAMAVIGAWLGPVGQAFPPAMAQRKLAELTEAWHQT